LNRWFPSSHNLDRDQLYFLSYFRLQTMMFSSNTYRFFICFLSLSLSATAESVRGVHRELVETAVDLRSAANYAILSTTGISTVPDSAITGDIGVFPIASVGLTGFSLLAGDGERFSTSTQITGFAYAADYLGNTPALLSAAVGDMVTAYKDAESRVDPDFVNFANGRIIVPTTLTAGLYNFKSTVSISADVVFSGSSTDIFIIQIQNNLLQSAYTKVTLSGGAQAKNIFWQVAGYVAVGTSAHMEGILLVNTEVTFGTSSSLKGRVLAQTACTIEKATIVEPAE
jgi:hypothetical protein